MRSPRAAPLRQLLTGAVCSFAVLMGGCIESQWTHHPREAGDRPMPTAARQEALPDRDVRDLEIAELRARIEKLENRNSPASDEAPIRSEPSPYMRLESRPVAARADSEQAASAQTTPGELGGTPVPAKEAPDRKLASEWNNGLVVKSADDAFRVHVGGRLQLDSGWNGASQTVQFGPGGTGELADGAYFRRATLRIDGTMYQHIEWVTEFDFANNVENDTTSSSSQAIGSPSFVNVWIAANDLPLLGTVRAGWMKEPIGFAHLTSSRWLNFMERAPGIGSLSLRSPGIMLLNWSEDERVTWAAGFYHVQNDNFGFGVGDGQYAETGRVTWLPWYEDQGSELLHVGLGATHRHLNDNQVDIKGRPSVRTEPGVLEPSLAETGTIGATTQDGVDVELAAIFGPWTFQSEYYGSFIHDAVFPNDPPPQGVARGTLFYQGAYVEVLYFLTGETRAYNRKEAVFDRVVPLRNFNVWDGSGGCGAWQIGLRYSFLDLQDKGVNGATLNDMVLGLNWFLNPNMKVQWNFAVDHRESTPAGSSGWTYIFGSRLALDF